MLYLKFGSFKELAADKDLWFMWHPGVVFDRCWELSWINSDLSSRIIEEAEGIAMSGLNTPLQECLIRGIRPIDFSPSTKSLLLARYMDECLIRMSLVGKNCYKYLMDIAEERDVFAGCTGPVYFSNADLKGRGVCFVSTGSVASTASKFYQEMQRIIWGGSDAQLFSFESLRSVS